MEEVAETDSASSGLDLAKGETVVTMKEID